MLINSHRFGVFHPSSLFSSGEKGVVFDSTDGSKIAQDSANTTPVTATGQDLKYVADQSGGGYNLTYNAGTVRWLGWPTSTNSQLLLSPTFATSSDWTNGTGWSIASNTATKTAGTASVLSQAVTLTAGKSYLVHFQLQTRTAGTIQPRFTGGTTVSSVATYNTAGSYYDILTAVSGNNTFELSADSSFAGTVTIAGIYEVSKWTGIGATFYNDGRLRSSAINMSSSKAGTFIAAGKMGFISGNRYMAGFGLTPTQVNMVNWGYISGYSGQVGDGTTLYSGTATSAADADNAYLRTGGSCVTCILDANEATAANQFRLRVGGKELTTNEPATPLSSHAMASGGQLNVGVWHNSSSFWLGQVTRVIAINRVLTADELAKAEAWCMQGMCVVAATGDSTWDQTDSTKGAGVIVARQVTDLVGGLIPIADISNYGDRTTHQKAKWDALSASTKSALQCVLVAVGHNEVKGRRDSGVSMATILTDFQAYIDKIRADVPSTCKIIGVALNPCKQWLDLATNPANCYAAWQDWNTAIQGGGSQPITGLDAVVTSHVSALNDGSDNLKSEYQLMADGVHPNNQGRFIVAQAVREKMVELGLLNASVSA